MYRPALVQTPTPGQAPTPYFGFKVLQRVSFSWGKHPPLQTLRRTKRAWPHLIFRHLGKQNTLKVLLFDLDKPHLPCIVLLADSSTVFVSKLCSTHALNISMGLYHYKFCEVRGKHPPRFKDQRCPQGGWDYTRNFTVLVQGK